MAQDEVLTRVSTGIAGLNEILHGGLVRERSYLVRGGPGTGKTTMGMHFLAAGAAAGEAVLWISLGEPATKLRQNAMAQGFDLQGVTFLDLSPSAEFFSEVETYDIFAPADVDREPMTQKIIDKVKALKPKRVFVDSMTQFRYLSADAFQFRKQALSFLRFLSDHGATVLLTAEGSTEIPDNDLQFMCDGVLQQSLELKRHNAELEALLDARKAVERMKDEFISIASHELRSPLNAIHLYLNMLLDEDAGMLTAEQERFLRVIEDNADRLTHLANDVLDISQMASGQLQLHIEPVELREIIEQACAELQILGNSKRIQTQVTLPSPLSPCKLMPIG